MLSTRSSACAVESPRGRVLHGVEIPVRPIVRIYGQQRRLGQEPRTVPVVRLRRMYQERMAQVHGPRIAGRGDNVPIGARREAVSGEFPQRQPLFSRGRKLPSDVRV